MRHIRWFGAAAIALTLGCEHPPEQAATSASSPADPTVDDSSSAGPDGGDPGTPDDMGPGSLFKCNPWGVNSDCLTGQKCNMYSTRGDAELDGAHCVQLATAPRQLDELCTVDGGYGTGRDDCAEGLTCWAVGPNNQGICVPLCNGCVPDPQCPDGRICAQGIGSYHFMCLPECDPLLQNCIEGDECVLVGRGFVCVQDHSGFEGQIYDTCEHANACDPGLVCSPPDAAPNCDAPDAAGCCLPFCTIGGSPCPDGLECIYAFDPEQFPDYVEVGICTAAP